ncbi:hypothetical protein ALC56_05902 [Trachymyrmex septentrionalis]|uniref:Uncharacterized protein n=1 Tax=Trachymyrmex septentrionalis TaxID=34720 RepID=A0A151JX81_9HYME|nr:hypothetical protein ALC56_05902 [Trachymyrmex septentrionalis]
MDSSVWARCSVAAAKKVVVESRLVIGWLRYRVEVLPQRPLQYFKCLGIGNVRVTCPSEMDHSICCYRGAPLGAPVSHGSQLNGGSLLSTVSRRGKGNSRPPLREQGLSTHSESG